MVFKMPKEYSCVHLRLQKYDLEISQCVTSDSIQQCFLTFSGTCGVTRGDPNTDKRQEASRTENKKNFYIKVTKGAEEHHDFRHMYWDKTHKMALHGADI